MDPPTHSRNTLRSSDGQTCMEVQCAVCPPTTTHSGMARASGLNCLRLNSVLNTYDSGLSFNHIQVFINELFLVLGTGDLHFGNKSQRNMIKSILCWTSVEVFIPCFYWMYSKPRCQFTTFLPHHPAGTNSRVFMAVNLRILSRPHFVQNKDWMAPFTNTSTQGVPEPGHVHWGLPHSHCSKQGMTPTVTSCANYNRSQGLWLQHGYGCHLCPNDETQTKPRHGFEH